MVHQIYRNNRAIQAPPFLLMQLELEEALEISHPDSSDRAALFNVLPLGTSNVVYKKDETSYQTKIASEPHFRLPLLLPIYFEVWLGLSRLRSVIPLLKIPNSTFP